MQVNATPVTLLCAIPMESPHGATPPRDEILMRCLFVCIGLVLMMGCNDTDSPNRATATLKKRESRNSAKDPLQVPVSPGIEYDKETYDRVVSFLTKDRTGMRIDEFLNRLGLKDVPYTTLDTPNMPGDALERLYHFNGFYMIVAVEPIGPAGGYRAQQRMEMHIRNEVRINDGCPFVIVDGLNNPKERLKARESITKNRFLKPDGIPKLRIESVRVLSVRTQPLQISLQFATNGTTPMALSQRQLSVCIATAEEPWLFVCKAAFSANEQDVFQVEPGQSLALSFCTSRNKFENGDDWADLPPGRYTLQVYVNGPKDREFDYQWSGQAYSNEFTLVIE